MSIKEIIDGVKDEQECDIIDNKVYKAECEKSWSRIAELVMERAEFVDQLANVREKIKKQSERIAELELRLGCCRDASTGKDLLIAELEEQNLNMMALFRDFYELEFNRDECWDIIKKYGGDA